MFVISREKVDKFYHNLSLAKFLFLSKSWFLAKTRRLLRKLMQKCLSKFEFAWWLIHTFNTILCFNFTESLKFSWNFSYFFYYFLHIADILEVLRVYYFLPVTSRVTGRNNWKCWGITKLLISWFPEWQPCATS